MSPEDRAKVNARPPGTRPGCYEIPSSSLPGALQARTGGRVPVPATPPAPAVITIGPLELLALAEEQGLDVSPEAWR